jgi:hypothetical protein
MHTLRIVKAQVAFVLFLTALVVAGCGGSPGTPSGKSPTAPDLTGNWQIQPSVIPQTIPLNAILLLGALQSSGSQVSGTFRFTNLGQPATCGLNQVVTLSGAIDSNEKLTLTSAALPNGTTIKVSLQISGSPPYSGTGTIEVDGGPCPVPPAAVDGEEIANTSGTYSGTLTPGAIGSQTPGASGTGTLTLTQSSSPASDGQFAATGTLSYQLGTCSGSAVLTGTVSGIAIALSTTSGITASPQSVSFAGFADVRAAKIAATMLSVPAPCSTDITSSAFYSGELARQ